MNAVIARQILRFTTCKSTKILQFKQIIKRNLSKTKINWFNNG